MKKTKEQTPSKSNLDIRSMFLSGIPKLINQTKSAVNESKKEEEKSESKKRKADEAFNSDEDVHKHLPANKKRKTSNSKTETKNKTIKTQFLTPSKKQSKEDTKSSRSQSKNKKSSVKKKKIIDDDSEDYVISHSESSEEEYKEESFESESDFKYDDFKEEEENGKSKKSKKGNKNSNVPINIKSKPSTRKNKPSNSMDLDEDELEKINEKFNEMETKEKKNKKRNSNINKNNISNISTLSQTVPNFSQKNLINKSNIHEAEQLTIKKKQERKKPKLNLIPECEGVLNGLTFVVTGVFSIERDDLTNILKGYGARVTSGVSKKTNYLLYGDQLEDGRLVKEGNKFKEATRLNVKRINQEEFEEIMRNKLNDSSFNIITALSNNGGNFEINLGKTNSNDNDKKDNTSINKIAGINQDVNDDIPKNSKQELWTSIHAPKDLNEIVGNQKAIFNLITWLDDWEDVVLNGNKKKVEFKGRGKIENLNARACLISGDPGIGKTTVVRLVAKLKGFRTYELNASDQRNKAIISSRLGFLINNKTLNHGEIQNKNLIIMDEVDGMAGNEDRGGMAALIDIIKKTKVPIICIANDKQNQKLRTLINYCYDLKFNKPDKRMIVSRLQEISRRENFHVEPNALEYLCESVGNDIRQCINFLEFWSRKFKELKYFDMSNKYNKFNKDTSIMISNFDAASKILNKQTLRKLTFREKLDLFFIDYDLIPLLIHENYLSCYTKTSTPEDLKTLVQSTEHISISDTIDKKIRRQQEWNLLQNFGIHSSLAVGNYSANFISFPRFPELFGKMQKFKKTKREVKELKYSFPSISSLSIIEEVSPLILSVITNCLIDTGKDGVESCLRFMRCCKLTMDMFKENIMDLQPGNKILLKYEKISPQIKKYFTQKYNEEFKTSIVRKKRKEAGESKDRYDDEGNVIEEINQDESEGMDEEINEKVTIKSKKEKSANSKDKSKSATTKKSKK